MRKLKVYYDGKPDIAIDAAIQDAMRLVGFGFYGSGYNYLEDERDLAFGEEQQRKVRRSVVKGKASAAIKIEEH